jgi:hypothetical protein
VTGVTGERTGGTGAEARNHEAIVRVSVRALGPCAFPPIGVMTGTCPTSSLATDLSQRGGA